MSQKISVQCTDYHFSCFKVFLFPKQLHNLSSPRLIGFDIVTKRLNFDIQSVMYAFVLNLNDCCIPHEGFNYYTITITVWFYHVVTCAYHVFPEHEIQSTFLNT